eukprot:GHVS01068640.1.p2 GENE.GHVS01068640.1~~GHVS01068640.1.p2  ORF type:complete len:106 (-),score=10.92 GHVS01068640.1:144-461(-)
MLCTYGVSSPVCATAEAELRTIDEKDENKYWYCANTQDTAVERCAQVPIEATVTSTAGPSADSQWYWSWSYICSPAAGEGIVNATHKQTHTAMHKTNKQHPCTRS